MDHPTFLKLLEGLAASCADSPLLAKVTALGARMLRKLTHAFERAWYPDVEKELIVDYGLTEPSPHDKMYVDPLKDWEVSNVNYYRDSFGRRVYLQLEGASAMLSAADFRDMYDAASVGDDDVDDDFADMDTASDANKSHFVYMEHGASFEHELPNGFFPPPALYDAGVHPPPPPLQSDRDAP
ncbi:hypothetical protein BWQ96_00547 [Gracilariopsis chorda]|uniref:Uncharacterized protein n=1 Tax=Gracilariopsis chorda TaxID=448386 RepID=A0A2V3J5J5_9FLOR|nr:hypothetical protein BWQ96_00547 [Gracilariopsis chorda]|eukprot:PXF49669.1 hypothetical protein BWQ96_00547 [Gracilariopsis chorda]